MGRSDLRDDDVLGLPDLLEALQLLLLDLECDVDADTVVYDPLAVVDHTKDVPVHYRYRLQGAYELSREVFDVQFGVYQHARASL